MARAHPVNSPPYPGLAIGLERLYDSEAAAKLSLALYNAGPNDTLHVRKLQKLLKALSSHDLHQLAEETNLLAQIAEQHHCDCTLSEQDSEKTPQHLHSKADELKALSQLYRTIDAQVKSELERK